MTRKETIARIKYIANDERLRVLKIDQAEWMNEKMAEIKRLVNTLPGKPWPPSD